MHIHWYSSIDNDYNIFEVGSVLHLLHQKDALIIGKQNLMENEQLFIIQV